MKHHLLALALLVCVFTDARAASGDLFVANEAALGSSIYQFSPNGSRSTFATNLISPIGLAFDSQGNLYVGDFFDSNTTMGIYKFAPDGSRTTFATGFTASGLLTLAFDKADNLYVGDVNFHSITKISPSGDKSTFFTNPDLVPYALAFDGAGNLFVGNHSGDIYKITPGGTQSIFATGTSLNYFGLAFDRQGNLLEFDNSSGGPHSQPGIVKFAPDGTRTMFALCPTNSFYGIAFDSAGNLFAGDGNGSIYKFAPDGTKSTFATGMTAPLSLAFAGTLPVPPPPAVSIAASGSSMTIQFAGILQQSTNLLNWADLDPQPANPWTSTPTNQYIFFRTRTAGD